MTNRIEELGCYWLLRNTDLININNAVSLRTLCEFKVMYFCFGTRANIFVSTQNVLQLFEQCLFYRLTTLKCQRHFCMHCGKLRIFCHLIEFDWINYDLNPNYQCTNLPVKSFFFFFSIQSQGIILRKLPFVNLFTMRECFSLKLKYFKSKFYWRKCSNSNTTQSNRTCYTVWLSSMMFVKILSAILDVSLTHMCRSNCRNDIYKFECYL